MGASKTAHYSKNEIEEALVGRALGHPARIRIIHILDEMQTANTLELTGLLELNITSVHNHLKKLIDANIVSVEFKNNGNQLILNRSVIQEFTLTMPIHF
jgi:DNA-binding transcriptional ArsR family regulator